MPHRTVPCHNTHHATPYRTTYHTITILPRINPRRGSTIRGHKKSMPNIKENTVEPRCLTIRAQPSQQHAAEAATALQQELIYSTAIQSKPPTQVQPASRCSTNSQPSPCNRTAAMSAALSLSLAEKENCHATSVSGL